MNIDLTEEEFNLIINYRKGKYNIDITEEEYNTIVNQRELAKKAYVKYIENIEKLINTDDRFVSGAASFLLGVAYQLHRKEIDLQTYKLTKDVDYDGDDEDTAFKIRSLNYIKNAIALHYPN